MTCNDLHLHVDPKNRKAGLKADCALISTSAWEEVILAFSGTIRCQFSAQNLIKISERIDSSIVTKRKVNAIRYESISPNF